MSDSSITSPGRRRACASLLFGPLAAAWLPAAATVFREDLPPPYISTPQLVVDRMLDMAGVTKEDFVVDLGCGDGRIVITAARRFGARGLGVEIDARLVTQARELARKAGVADRTRFEVQDALTTDLAQATLLTLYLGPILNEKLMPRILGTMRPGSRVVSHDFPLGSWHADRIEHLDVPEKNFGRGGESVVMLWVVPADVHGRWRAEIVDPAGNARVEEFSIAQNFQRIEGAIHRRSRDVAVVDARIDGAGIVFGFPADGPEPAMQRVRARVEGATMTGTLSAATGGAAPPLAFKATRIARRPGLR